MNALVVDDSTLMRKIVKDNLARVSIDVVAEASNGIDAVKKYRELNPDIVTMDITMDRMNGLDALKQIMAIDPDANVVMVSAMGQKYFTLEALKEGAVDFIVKPFQPYSIEEAVKKINGETE